MKPKTDFDPLFESKGRRSYGPIRSIGMLLIAVAPSGVALRAGPIPAPRPARSVQVAPSLGGRFVLQGPVRNSRAGVAQSPDRFAIVAPAEIDPGMVMRAREDLDVEMVFNPEAGRRGSPPSGPAQVVVPWLPGPVPAPAPEGPRPR